MVGSIHKSLERLQQAKRHHHQHKQTLNASGGHHHFSPSPPPQHGNRSKLDLSMISGVQSAVSSEVDAEERQSEASERDLLQQLEQTDPSERELLLARTSESEKTQLVLLLLHQNASLQRQKQEMVLLGEQIASGLLHQQHELRRRFAQEQQHLQQQLHEALHAHPQVAALHQQLEQLQVTKHQQDQKLLFATRKLQQSRQREKELQLGQNPLWDF